MKLSMRRVRGPSLSLSLISMLALAACGKKEPPAPTPTATATAAEEDAAAAPAADTAAAAPAGCIDAETSSVLGSLDPDFARLDGRKVVLCGNAKEERRCVTLDLDSGERTSTTLPEDDVAHLPAFPPGFADGLLKDESRPVLKLCPPDATTCKDLHVGGALAGHFDADKKRVVITSHDEGKISAHIYDTETQTQRAVWPVAETAIPDCSFAAFVGERLLISSGACSGGGRSWLADAETGEKVADVGKREDAFVRDGQYAHVGGKLWAFRDAGGKRVYLQDVGSGEVSATVDLEAIAEGTKPKDDSAFVLADQDTVVLIESRPLVGTVVVANPGDGSVVKSYVPRPCM